MSQYSAININTSQPATYDLEFAACMHVFLRIEQQLWHNSFSDPVSNETSLLANLINALNLFVTEFNITEQ
jgi:hypothetical protein